ncbi:MAG: serine phosphatase RsbU (regulator of sigma subunit), partial [Parvicellaceae bacterium]
RAILPEKHDLGQLGDYFMLYMPRDIVSGDFYWYFKRGDDQYFAVADCTGHGVPGAFISMLCHNAISQVIIEKGKSDPGEILSLVNKEVLKRLKKKGDKFQASDGMDIILCKYNKIQSSFKFSGAFNSLLLLSKRSIIEHKVDRVAIGGTTDFDFEFKTQDLEYSSGDIVYLRTDGYQDQFGGKKGKRFLKKKLNAILQNFETVEMQDQQEILVKELAEWQLGYRQVDDITLMGLKLS